MSSIRPVARLLLLALCAAVAGASLLARSGPAGAASRLCPESNRPNEIVVAGGSGQTAQLGLPFQTPFQVRLANTNDCPLTGNLAGFDINFDAPGSGASGFFAGSGGREAFVGTDGNGVATAPAFTANFTPGAYTVDAHSDFGSVEFFVSNTAAGLAASIAAGAGTPQEATVDSQYGQSLQARVTDAAGNPVQGATVNFAVVPGPYGAAARFLAGGVQTSAKTDADGVAVSPPLEANGSPGRFTATASTDGVPAVATYTLDNHATADTLAAADDPAQTTTIASRYPQPLTARFLDPTGQPIEGAAVTFTLGSGSAGGSGAPGPGASFLGGSQATVVTDREGLATSPPFVANGTPGGFGATATVAGVVVPLSYRLRNLAARLTAPHAVASATVGARYRNSLAARVRDAHGKPVEGVTVSFAIQPSHGGAAATFADGTSQATATTDDQGVARSPGLTANASAGSFTATATLAGSGIVRYSLRNRAAAPAAVAVGAANGQSLRVGTRLPLRLAVTVTDANGNPVAGATVTFTAPRSGPGGRFVTHGHGRTPLRHGRRKPQTAHRLRVVRSVTNAEGIAVAPPFTAGKRAGGYVVRVRAGSVRSAFALVNTPS